MHRYYFDISDNGVMVRDGCGMELEGWNEARRQVLFLLPAMVNDLPQGADRHEFTALVRREVDDIGFKTTLSINSEWVGVRDHLP